MEVVDGVDVDDAEDIHVMKTSVGFSN